MNKYKKMYEDILLACRTGEVVIIEDEEDCDYAAIRYDNYSKLVISIWSSSIQECKLALYGETYCKEAFIDFAKDYNIKIVETYTPEYDRVPVGTKVLVKEDSPLTGATRGFRGSVLEITGYKDNHYVINQQLFPRSAFTVILPEEEKEEEPKTITLDGVEYILTPKQK